jgi:hypothetical protein
MSINLCHIKREYKYEQFLKETYNKILKNYPLKLSKSNKTAVIVEFRKHKWFEYILVINMYFLKDWKLHVFCGLNNYDYVKNILDKHINNYKITRLQLFNLSVDEYSCLLTNKYFWKQIETNKILIFQVDSLILKDNINNYIHFNYIGAPWTENIIKYYKYSMYQGNGGISIRSKEYMLEIIERYDRINEPEDVYFSKHIIKLNKENPSFQECKDFSSEHYWSYNSTCLHKAYLFHKIDYNKLIKYIDKYINV